MPAAPVRVAVIGVGGIGRLFHLPAYRTAQSDGFAQLIAVCDPVEEGLRVAVEDFGVPHVYHDYRDLLERDDVDLVSICTPNVTHEEIAIAAIESGKHVMCEKPLATTVDGARRMAATADRLGRRTAVNFRYRWIPSARYLADIIADGELGEIYHVHFQYFNGWAHDPDAPIRWRQIRSLSGSGAIGDIGSHLIDLAHHWIGPLRRVHAVQRTFVPERRAADRSDRVKVDVDDATFCLLEFANGASGTLSASTFAVGHTNHQRVEIYGTKGSAIYEIHAFDHGGDQLRLCFGRSQGRHGGFVVAPIPRAHAQSTPLHPMIDFVRAVQLERDYRPTFEDGARCQQVIEAIDQSAASGTWVSLPEDY